MLFLANLRYIREVTHALSLVTFHPLRSVVHCSQRSFLGHFFIHFIMFSHVFFGLPLFLFPRLI